jgi:hypothetical protein
MRLRDALAPAGNTGVLVRIDRVMPKSRAGFPSIDTSDGPGRKSRLCTNASSISDRAADRRRIAPHRAEIQRDLLLRPACARRVFGFFLRSLVDPVRRHASRNTTVDIKITAKQSGE